MRIVIHDFGGYPFSAQLARALATRGHHVVYLYAAGIKAPRARVEERDGDPNSITIRGITLEEMYQRGAGVRRLRQERRYGTLLGQEITRAVPDVVISANCPLDAQTIAQSATHHTQAAFVHWCQDVYSLAVTRLLERRFGLLGRVVGARFARLERQVMRASDAVVLIAEDFMPLMREWQVPEQRISVIENWAPLEEIQPKANDWAVRHGVSTTPVFLYAGTLGRKHDPMLLMGLADAVPGAKVLVVSEGAATDRLHSVAPTHANLQLLPLQPASDLSKMLASADVLVAILDQDAGEFSVPSKVLTYLAAGRPILAAVPGTNLAARTIIDAGAGVVVHPRDHEGFATAARKLLNDAETRTKAGTAARTYAEREFAIGPIADRFVGVLNAAVLQAHSQAGKRHDTDGAPRTESRSIE